MRVPSIAAAAAVTLAAGCEVSFAAPPRTAYRITPPAAYREAWREVEQCSGRRAPFDQVRWYAVPDSTMPCPAGQCSGLWYPPHDIYLTELHVHDPAGEYFVARHEMLHDLLQVASHPETFCTCRLGGTEPEMGGCLSR